MLNGLDERTLTATGGPQLVREMLHDVHIVRHRQHQDQRGQHARQHVVLEAHQRVEAHRPDRADQDREDHEHRQPPGTEHHIDAEDHQDQNRRREHRRVRQRDAIVGLADLEAAVVVRLHPAWEPGIDHLVNRVDHCTTVIVDPVLVERNHDRRHGAVLGQEITAKQVVVQDLASELCWDARLPRVPQEGAYFDAATVVRLARRRRHGSHGVGSRQAVHPLHKRDALDILGNGTDELQRLWGEERLALKRDQEGATAAELVTEVFVLEVGRIRFRDPGTDVVVEGGDVDERRQPQRTEYEREGDRMSTAPEQPGDGTAHCDTRSSARRLKSSSVRPML